MTALNTTDLSQLTMNQLVARYNELADSPVKTFRNKAQAVAAIDELEANYASTEDEPMEAIQPTPSGELSSLVGAMLNPAPTEPEAEEGPALISLQTLCNELQVVPRIARRRLRKALGLLTEGRWEFTEDQLDEVRAIIQGTASTNVQAATDADE